MPGAIRVAPEPEQFAAVDRGLGRVLPHYFAVDGPTGDGRPFAQQNAVAIDAPARDAVQTLGDVDPPDLQLRLSARGRRQGHSPAAERLLRELVAGAGNAEPHRLAHQARLVEGDIAVAIGVVSRLVGRFQPHQRHSTAACLVHHPDAEILAGLGPGGAGPGQSGGDKQSEKEAVHNVLGTLRVPSSSPLCPRHGDGQHRKSPRLRETAHGVCRPH
jgi:hypothetical protein